MKVHTKKIATMLSRETDVDVHSKNISSYRLSFFEKLVLCRGLKFAVPTRVCPKEVQASFESLYHKLEPSLPEDKKELTATTLRSIALSYIVSKHTPPPKSLLRVLNQLKKRNDIVITKPDKGTGVVVMDKSEYTK